ncbi:MAG: hypothetical protein RR048_02725 [Oscillospiraceae bacterium]
MKKTDKKTIRSTSKIKKNLSDKFVLKIFSLSFAVTILFLFVTYSVVVVKNKCSYLSTDFYKIEISESSPHFDAANTVAEYSERIIPMFFPKVYFAQQLVYAIGNI